MDAVEFIRERNRMCKHFRGCNQCPADGMICSTIWEMNDVDAVPVVRCKECKWAGGDFVCYRGVMVQHKPEDFCSYGERRGGGEDG